MSWIICGEDKLGNPFPFEANSVLLLLLAPIGAAVLPVAPPAPWLVWNQVPGGVGFAGGGGCLGCVGISGA